MTYLHVFWRSLFRIIIDWIHCSPGKSPGKSDTTSLLYWMHACNVSAWYDKVLAKRLRGFDILELKVIETVLVKVFLN